MAFLSVIREFFGRTTSPYPGTHAQNQERTSTERSSTASEGSDDGEVVRGTAVPRRATSFGTPLSMAPGRTIGCSPDERSAGSAVLNPEKRSKVLDALALQQFRDDPAASHSGSTGVATQSIQKDDPSLSSSFGGSLSDPLRGLRRTAGHQTSLPSVEPGLVISDKTIEPTPDKTVAGSTAFDLGEISDTLGSQTAVLPPKSNPQRLSDSSPENERVPQTVAPVDPSQRSGLLPGTYGYRYMERERLNDLGYNISGGSVDKDGNFRSRFESDHLYSFSTTHPKWSRVSEKGKEAVNKGLAYFEFGNLHQDHISSQNIFAVMAGNLKIAGADHGWSDPGVFRNNVRWGALRDPQTMATGENLSVAGQLHILDYGFLHKRARENGSSHGAYPDSAALSAARDSFVSMLKSSPTVHYVNATARGQTQVAQDISAKTRAELILANQAAVESKYPSNDDVKLVAKAQLSQKDYDEKKVIWDAQDKELGHRQYDERTRMHGRQ